MNYSNCIFVDVFPWVGEIVACQDLPIVGVYRAIYFHCRTFTPAIFLDNELQLLSLHESFLKGIEVLEKYIGKKIEIIYKGDIFDHCLWMGCAVDHFCPFMVYEYQGLIKSAILHDVMAFTKVFGEQNHKNFLYSLQYIEVFFYVSETSLKAFKALTESLGVNLELKTLIPLPNAHNLSDQALQLLKVDVDESERRQFTSLSVSSVYPYKNLLRTIEVAIHLLFNHYHVGQFFKTDWEQYSKLAEEEKFSPLGRTADSELSKLYSLCGAYISMSLCEGFSLGAMEAILMRIPVIILSDIPVHREIYGEFNVNFFSTEMGDMSFMGTKLKKITNKDRIRLFKRNAYMNTIQPLLNFCAQTLDMDLSHYEGH
jgi:glycosyltransferase involved in cell wall biosynthesis